MSEAPTYLEPRIGWRTWRLAIDQMGVPLESWSIATHESIDQLAETPPDGRYTLVSGEGTHWPGYERLEARCGNGKDHRCPDSDCQCGVYAARSLNILRRMGYAADPDSENFMPDVLGELAMWGRMIENDNILRAEFAYPKRLIVPHVNWRWAKPLRESYGCPVEIHNVFTMDEESK